MWTNRDFMTCLSGCALKWARPMSITASLRPFSLLYHPHPGHANQRVPQSNRLKGSWGLTRSVWLSSCEIQVSNRCRFPLSKAKSRAQGWGTRQSQDVLVTCYYCVWCKINYAVDFTSDLFWVILVEFQAIPVNKITILNWYEGFLQQE